MNKVWLVLGSNMSDRLRILESATRRIAEAYDMISMSHIVESQDVCGGPTIFANQIVEIATDLSIASLYRRLKDIEAQYGSRRKISDRDMRDAAGCNLYIPLDIDVAVYEGRIVKPDDTSRPYFRTILSKGLWPVKKKS